MIFTSRIQKLPYSWPVSMTAIEHYHEILIIFSIKCPKRCTDYKNIVIIYYFHEIWWLHDAYKQFWQNANFTKLYMPVSLHVLVCQAQNFDQWCIMVPALQICKELKNNCPTLRDMGNEICVLFVKMKSWQSAKFLELSASDPFSAAKSIPINFDHTISKCYYVQLQLLLAFHTTKI